MKWDIMTIQSKAHWRVCMYFMIIIEQRGIVKMLHYFDDMEKQHTFVVSTMKDTL